jgi:predicted nuclease of predicted toxin-antitoxin system
MKYLVDENISKPDKFIEEHPEFANVKKVIRTGADDSEILQKARSEDRVIITKDIRLALRALIYGIGIIYFDEENREHKLRANPLVD